jgi:hypothetical protein
MIFTFLEGEENDKASIRLATSKNGWIKNVRRLQRSPEAMKAAAEIHKGKFPAIKQRSSSSLYNCFGLVFASRRTCIIDGNEVEKILSEDGYSAIGRVDADIHDVVVFREKSSREIVHCGLVAEVKIGILDGSRKIMVVSQWGADGEYLHPVEGLPEMCAGEAEYYTLRS